MKSSYLENPEFKRVKTFMASMNLFEMTLKQRQAFLKDKRLSMAEKEILECSILLKDCLYPEIIHRLRRLNSENELIVSQKNIILGTALACSGACEEAKAPLIEAIQILSKQDLHRYSFYALNQLFYVHLNLKDNKAMSHVLDELRDLDQESVKDQISFLRCQFNYFTFTGNFRKAQISLDKLDQLGGEMHSSQQIGHLIDKFVFYLKQDQLANCEQILCKMKDYRRHNFSANYKFMKALLGHIMHRSPIYLYAKDFKESPILYFQLRVIQALEAGEEHEAKSFWDKLHKLNSEVYGTFMDYHGDKCLFSLCLGLYQKRPLPQMRTYTSKEEQLIQILRSANGPVKKEELVKLLWKHEISSKEDLTKLAMLISRIRTKHKLEILSRRGCFILKAA